MIDKLITKEDIIAEVAEETGKDIKVVEAVVNHNLKYLKKMVSEDEEVVSINLPNLGALKVNYLFNLSMTNKHEIARKRMEILKDKENFPNKLAYKKPLVYMINYKYGRKIRNTISKFFSIVKSISLDSNKKNNELFN